MKLALEIDGKQVNHVVIKSLEGSIDFCKDFESTEETAQLVTSLKRVLKLYKDAEHKPRWLARPVKEYPAFIRGQD
jgi:hypothetical protein